MWGLFLALQFSMPYEPDEFLQTNIIDEIEPEVIAFVSGLAGIAAFKFIVYRR